MLLKNRGRKGQGISDGVKAEIKTRKRQRQHYLKEETGHIEVLNRLQIEEAREEAGTDDAQTEQDQAESQELEELGLES